MIIEIIEFKLCFVGCRIPGLNKNINEFINPNWVDSSIVLYLDFMVLCLILQ